MRGSRYAAAASHVRRTTSMAHYYGRDTIDDLLTGPDAEPGSPYLALDGPLPDLSDLLPPERVAPLASQPNPVRPPAIVTRHLE